MHLREYLQSKQISRAAFGQQLKPPVSGSKVGHWIDGRRRVSLTEGLQVLRLSDGQVSLEELASMYRPGKVVGDDSHGANVDDDGVAPASSQSEKETV